MVRGKKRHVLSPSEVQALKNDQRDMDGMLAEADREQWGDKGRLDTDALRRQSRKLGHEIEQGTPRKIKAATKDKMAARARELEEIFKQGMPTQDEMWDLKHHPGAPMKNLNWQKRNAKGIAEYKQLQRELEPGDPTASSIEHLRRK